MQFRKIKRGHTVSSFEPQHTVCKDMIYLYETAAADLPEKVVFGINITKKES